MLVTCAFIVFGGPGIVTVYIPAWITRWQIPSIPWGWRLLAFVLITFGLLPLGESIFRFIHHGRGTLSPSHPTDELVTSGFYQYVRNTMYPSVLVLIAAQAVLFRSWVLSVYMGLVAVGFHLFVVFYEEPILRKKYGSSYDKLCHDVPRWIPRVRFRRQTARPG